MSRGNSKKFAEYDFKSGLGDYNNSTDVFSWVLITDSYGDINENQANPKLSSFNVVSSGGNYSGKTALTGGSWSRSGAKSKLDFDSITFAGDESNPTSAKCLLIINDTSSNDDAMQVFDLTTDGTTAVNMTQGFTFDFNSDGAVTITTNA